jgi:type VI secretion system secreted protein VgrG
MTESMWLKVTSPLDADARKFFLRDFEGEEELSGLFRYRLNLTSLDNAVDFTALLGETMTILVGRDDGKTRYINGQVTQFLQAGYDGTATTYVAELKPWFWRLTLTANSKIYQNLTVVEIITGLFDELGFTDYENACTKTYTKREYTVWYQESAYNFVCRLFEAEGIYYFFKHEDGKHTLVMGDDAATHPDCPDFTEAVLRDVEPEHDGLISRCYFQQQLVSNKFATEDYNFETPETDLLVPDVDGAQTGALRVYEYPGDFKDSSGGTAVADLRIEAIELPIKYLRGESFCKAMTAGHKFSLTEHYRAEYNQAYVLRWVSIKCNSDRYTNQFLAFPADVPFRPPRVTPRPRIHSTQTALVVGKAGEEIWTDQYGRVKVQFYWDQIGAKDENSSCWIRVGQYWAGKSWGTLFTPRIGAEVIVSFLEGDPDRPLIVGTVYNATQTVPYALPGEMNKSTILTRSTKQGAAGNEIRFEDTKGSEEIYGHAQKDVNILIENNITSIITKNRTTTIKDEHDKLTLDTGNRTVTLTKGNLTTTVTEGNLTTEVSKGTETHTVKSNRTVTVSEGDYKSDVTKGKETRTVGGERSLTVTGNETHTSKADFTHKVTGNYTLKVTGDLTVDVTGAITIKTPGAISIKSSGGAVTVEGTSGLTLKSAATAKLEAGATLDVKGSAMATVDGGGMLTLKGGLIKVG